MHTPIGETLHRLLHAYKRAMRDGYTTAGIELTVSSGKAKTPPSLVVTRL